MWQPKERITLLSGFVLPPSAVTTFTNIWPLDRTGWYKIRLHLHCTLAAVATPFADGAYRFIKGITLRTSRGEVLLNNVPGMALFRLNSILNHSQPFHDPHLAAGGPFCAVLDLPLTFSFLNRLEDTILDTGRYGNLELQISTGSLAVFAPAAPATCPVLLGIEIERTMSAMEERQGDVSGKPAVLPYIGTYPNQPQSVNLFWDLESSLDLGIFGFFISSQDVLLVEGAVPFCHPAAGGSDNLTNVSLEDTARRWINFLPFETFREDRRALLPYSWYDGGALPVAATEIATSNLGIYPYIFVKNGSLNEVYVTGGKARIRLSYTLVGAAGTLRTDLCVFGMRTLR